MSMFKKFSFQNNQSLPTVLLRDCALPKIGKKSGRSRVNEDLPSTPPPSSPDIQVIPDTPLSELPEASSPIFGKSIHSSKDQAQYISSSEDDEERQPLSSTKRIKVPVAKSKSRVDIFEIMSSQSEGESSEESGVKANSRPCSSTSGYCSTNDTSLNGNDRQERLKKLQELFVRRSKEELEDIVNSTKTMDEAVTVVLDLKGSKKRRRVMSSDYSQDTPVRVPTKRARKQPKELEDSFTESDATMIDSENRDALIAQLIEKFPEQDAQDLERILENSDWSVDAAAIILLSLRDEDNLTEITSQEKVQEVNMKQKQKKQSPEPSPTRSKKDKKNKKKATTQEGYRRIVVVISSDEEQENGDTDDSHQDNDSDVEDVTGLDNKTANCPDEPDGECNGNTDDKEEPEEEEEEGMGDEDGYDSDDSYMEEGIGVESKVVILSFFNEASVDELQLVPYLSKKKGEKIMKIRPFTSWVDLVEKVGESRGLGIDLIYDSKTILEEREILKRLMHKCSKISTALQKIISRSLENESGPVEVMEGQIMEQPKLLNSSYSLKPFQMIGLNWLVLLHRQEVNGILADEMGLGKTIMTIAFLAHMLEEGDSGPYLIVVPSSTMDNWIRELNKWCPALHVVQYYGSQDERRSLRYRILSRGFKFNVMVSTYNVCMNCPEDRNLFKKITFRYMIIDEGHMLKNMNTQRYKSLMKIKADRRLLLTGTPLQNNLLELMSLLCFVMPKMFMTSGSTDHLKRMFATKVSSSDSTEQNNFEKDRIADAKQIMQPFLLRRVKTEVLKQLPKKHDAINKCPLSESQREQYNKLVISLSKTLRGTSDTCNLAGAMMQLRKMANHSLLHRYHYDDQKLRKMSKLMLKEPTHEDANPELIYEDMCVMSDFELHQLCIQYYYVSDFTLPTEVVLNSGKFYLLDKLLPEMKQRGDRVLLFSQFTMMLDIIEVYMRNNKHKFLRLDGRTAVKDRLELIDKYNSEDDIFVFLLSTKAGGLGINLTAANVVIIHDIDFNPYNDKQAEDRCHRVGQTREVNVLRVVSENTIEEAILKCAMGKLKLEADITANASDDDDNVTDMATLLRESLDL